MLQGTRRAMHRARIQTSIRISHRISHRTSTRTNTATRLHIRAATHTSAVGYCKRRQNWSQVGYCKRRQNWSQGQIKRITSMKMHVGAYRASAMSVFPIAGVATLTPHHRVSRAAAAAAITAAAITAAAITDPRTTPMATTTTTTTPMAARPVTDTTPRTTRPMQLDMGRRIVQATTGRIVRQRLTISTRTNPATSTRINTAIRHPIHVARQHVGRRKIPSRPLQKSLSHDRQVHRRLQNLVLCPQLRCLQLVLRQRQNAAGGLQMSSSRRVRA